MVTFAGETVERGVRDRSFSLGVGERVVHGGLWEPEQQPASALVLVGHGGGQHKRDPMVLALARRLVRHAGVAVAAIDHLPAHGDRPPDPDHPWWGDQQRLVHELEPADFEGQRSDAVASLDIDEIVGDWTATLNELLDIIDAGRVCYVGFSGGAGIGVCLLAAEPRITAAAVGLAGTDLFRLAAEAAPVVNVPTLFFMQWDDEVISRASALDLFDRLGSLDKTLHANPGRHADLPAHEVDAIEHLITIHCAITP